MISEVFGLKNNYIRQTNLNSKDNKRKIIKNLSRHRCLVFLYFNFENKSNFRKL